MTTHTRYLEVADGDQIAYRQLPAQSPGNSPGIVFCGGFFSDMEGTKALALEHYCRQHGRAYLRFDYFGHGESSGTFASGTIGRWAADALAVVDRLTEGPQVLVGSSMGAWIMLLVALARPQRIAGLLGVASAPDFTEELIWSQLDAATRKTLQQDGVIFQPSDYDHEPHPITLSLIEEARAHLLLNGPILFQGPVRLLHGLKDADVPWQVSLRLADRLTSQDVRLTLVKDGDHRLSEPAHLQLLSRSLTELLHEIP